MAVDTTVSARNRPAEPASIGKVIVVVVNFNGWEDTRECLVSLQVALSPVDGVVVVDNGSTCPPTREIHSEFPWVTYLANDQNLGWSGGNNTGIRYALQQGADWVMLLNNDTVVSPTFFNRHREVTQRHPDLALYGPMIHEYTNRDRLQTAACWFNRQGSPGFLQSDHFAAAGSREPEVKPTDIVNGCCLLARHDVFPRIGLIDDAYFLIHEEADFCLRAKRAGFRLGVLAEPHIWHKHSVSFQRAGKPLQRYYDARNLRRLIGTHAGKLAGGRPWGTSLALYWRYLLHLTQHELELGNVAGARAVVDGWSDAALGRYGPRSTRLKPLAAVIFPIIRVLLATRRRFRRQPVETRG